jgi:RHS repeat-associated protein
MMSKLHGSKGMSICASAARSLFLRAALFLPFLLGVLFPAPEARAQALTYTYDTGCAYGVGRLCQVTDPTGSTTFTYDQRGRSTRVDKVIDGTTYTTQATYDSINRIVDLTYPGSGGGEVVRHTYNSRGLIEKLSSTSYALDYVSSFGYNDLDKVTSKNVGNGKTTTYTYDPLNFRLTGLSTPSLQNLTYAYDNVGNITGITDGIKAGTQSFSYDDLDRLTSASGGDSPGYSHTYTYNAIGNLTGMNSTGAGGAQTVDSSGDVGYRTSLKLDSSGNPHISYFDSTNSAFKYATKSPGTAWSIQTVESFASTTEVKYTSLALDNSGNPHISYSVNTRVPLKYAKWTGTAWSIQVVDPWYAENISIALDSSGNPHISYYYINGNDDLRYAKWTSTTWDIQTVDSTGNVGRYPSIAIDISGNPHISYLVNNGALKYVKKTGSTWGTPVTVDSTASMNGNTSIALDSSGNPHISYYDDTSADLKYAKWTGSAWAIQTVDSAGYVGFYNSLALDSAGRPRIAYSDNTNGNLKYASWTGSSWDIQVLDSAGNVGDYTSLALDSSGNPHISYYDSTSGDLRYYAPPTGTTAFSYPAAGSARPHAPTSDGTCSYSYDANGNMTTRVCGSTTRTFTWDAKNRLTQVADNGATLATFAYDYAGARVKKVEGSNTTYYPFAHYKVPNGSPTKYYFANGRRVAERDSTGLYYYHPDHLGSSNVVSDSAGTEVKATLFYPYGSTRTETGTKEIIHKYTGKELDSSTGLYDYGARYYDPSFMHFITADSVVPNYKDPQSLNHYAYVRNNPIRLIDPTGHEDLDFDEIGVPLPTRPSRADAIAQGASFAPLIAFLAPYIAPQIVAAIGISTETVLGSFLGGVVGSAMMDPTFQLARYGYKEARGLKGDEWSWSDWAMNSALGGLGQALTKGAQIALAVKEAEPVALGIGATMDKFRWTAKEAAILARMDSFKSDVARVAGGWLTTPLVWQRYLWGGTDPIAAIAGSGVGVVTRNIFMTALPMETLAQRLFAQTFLQRTVTFGLGYGLPQAEPGKYIGVGTSDWEDPFSGER